MKIYLDTNILGVRIFGSYSEAERIRTSDVNALFQKIENGLIDATVSFYVLQELYALCETFATGAAIAPFPIHLTVPMS